MIIETYGHFYTCDPKCIGENEYKSIEKLKRHISETSTYQSNLIINLTWFDRDKTTELLSWIDRYKIENSTKIYLTAYVDGAYWFTREPIYEQLIYLGYSVEIEGFGPNNWYSWIPSWMQDYSLDELSLHPSPQYTFLSYNRKPKYHRKELVQSIIDNDLLKFGWVTYEHGEFSEIDSYSGNTDQELHSPDLRFSRPEDLRSLGNMNIWNNSYCVIVSETEPTDPWQLTEKTWKPIMGMRPFLINGDSNISNVLKNLGFITPGIMFENIELDSGKIAPLISQLKTLCDMSSIELNELWNKQKEMLLHNRNRFKQIAIDYDPDVPVSA